MTTKIRAIISFVSPRKKSRSSSHFTDATGNESLADTFRRSYELLGETGESPSDEDLRRQVEANMPYSDLDYLQGDLEGRMDFVNSLINKRGWIRNARLEETIQSYTNTIIRTRQILQGDRSDPLIAALDAITLTFDNWQKKKGEVERILVLSDCRESVWQEAFKYLKDKEAAHHRALARKQAESKRAPARKQAKKKAANESDACVICLEYERTHILFPCGHYNFCEDCVLSLRKHGKNCPVCRKGFTHFTKVFG